MRQKYVRHYRHILPWVLEHLTFRSENRFQPVIEALVVIKRYLGTKYQYFPEEVPIEGVVLPRWRDTVLEVHPDGTVRVNRRYDELCVLQQLERALKCKEIWVEGSYAFRNPHQDMPPIGTMRSSGMPITVYCPNLWRSPPSWIPCGSG